MKQGHDQEQQNKTKDEALASLSSSSSSKLLPTLKLREISAETFSKVIEYLYSDQIQELSPPLVFDVLEAANRYLLPGLRALCGAVLVDYSEEIDVFYLHSLARLYDLPRLEHHSFEIFAKELDDCIWTDDFAELIQESASAIKSREDIDSIPFLDEIRYHICRQHKYDQQELERKYILVDELLDKLKLGA